MDNGVKSMRFPKVSVLILTYNSRKYLDRCFISLEKQTYPNYEVVMVDNASTDGSVEFVRENFPWVKIIALDKNYGYAEAYNTAVRQVKSKYVVFLNPDVEVECNWLEELVKVAESDEDIKICGSRILFYDNKDIIQNDGGWITPIGGGLSRNHLKRAIEVKIPKTPQYVGYAHGASMLVDRHTFLKLGGFDPDYFMYHEEVDLCWRAWLWGYKVAYVPTSIVYHDIGGSSGAKSLSKSPFRLYHERKNQLMNILKNFSFLNIIFAIFILFIFDSLCIMRYLIRKDFELIKSIFKAYGYVISNFRLILKKRCHVQRKRKIDETILTDNNIILSLKNCIYEYLRLLKHM